MSRQQLMNMYQRQVALGGMASGGDGGLFTAQSRAGLADYREWHAEYKMAHPDAGRDELKAAWRMHKMSLGEAPPRGRALVGGRRMPKGLDHCAEYKIGPSGLRRCARMAEGPGGGYSDMTPFRGRALVGGARMSKGVRHCMLEDSLGPSGRKRCVKYMAGPRSAMHGSALVGGFPGQAELFKRWRKSNECPPPSAAYKAARMAYEANSAKSFREGVRAAMNALGLPADESFVLNLRKPRARVSKAKMERAGEAVAKAQAAAKKANSAAIDAAAAASKAEILAEHAAMQAAPDVAVSDEQLAELLG